MKALVNICIIGLLALVAMSSRGIAQTASTAEARLKELNITLPTVPPPIANYVDSVQGRQPAVPCREYGGSQLEVQGQGWQGSYCAGRLRHRPPGWRLIMLAKVRAALGSLDRVKRIVKVLGMVNSADGFGDQPRVVNGFSDLMVDVFGEAIGKHARSAVGMAGLPSNSAVEVEMIVEIEVKARCQRKVSPFIDNRYWEDRSLGAVTVCERLQPAPWSLLNLEQIAARPRC